MESDITDISQIKKQLLIKSTKILMGGNNYENEPFFSINNYF